MQDSQLPRPEIHEITGFINDFIPATPIPSVIGAVSCSLPKVPEGQEIVSIDVEQEEQKEEDPTPRDSEPIDNSLTPFERMEQTMLDHLRQAYNLDPTGEHRAVCVMVTLDNGKTFQCLADSTEEDKFKNMEVWSRSYVEAEVTKIKTAYTKNPAGPVTGNEESTV